MLYTGYLTYRGRDEERQLRLAIPNREITELFTSQIWQWFRETTREDAGKLEEFCRAFPEGNASVIEEILKGYLWNSISVRDVAVRREMKENFYHGILLGLLQYEADWRIDSNAESGEGCCDIAIRTPERTGVIIEIKYVEDGDLEKGCKTALEQIENKKYDTMLMRYGMEKIMKYGITFFRKNCKVEKA